MKMFHIISGCAIALLVAGYFYISAIVEQRDQEVTKLKADLSMQGVIFDRKHASKNKIDVDTRQPQ